MLDQRCLDGDAPGDGRCARSDILIDGASAVSVQPLDDFMHDLRLDAEVSVRCQ